MPEEEQELSEDLQNLLDQIGDLSVLELSNLVKALEKKFGVSASAPAVAAAGAGAQAGAEEEGEEEEEQTEFDVLLAEIGDKKLKVIKELRKVTDFGLKEAKDFVEGDLPATIKEAVPKADGEKTKEQLEDVGATIELK